MATILTKKSDTASAVPLAADLTNAAGGAELAVNATDKRLFSKTSGGTVVELGTNPSTLVLPSGSANGVAYLNGSKVVTSGSALTFDGTNLANTGNITAGTTSSGANLNAYASIYNSNGMVRLFGTDGNNKVEFGAASATTAFLTARAGVSMIFGANDAEQMRLTSTGLGIGTSSPSEKLTVNGNIKLGTSGTSYIYGPATTGRSFFANSDSTAYIGIYGSSYGSSLDSVISFVAGTSNSMTFNASGNLGLGVTPSAWANGTKAFDIGSGSSLFNPGSSTLTWLMSNAYNNGTNFIYKNTGAAGYYSVGTAHSWHTAPSGTAGNAITFTQAMTLSADGKLGIGETSPAQTLVLKNTSSAPYLSFIAGSSSVMGVLMGTVGNTVDGQILYSNSTQAMTFVTASGERARIDSSGNLLVGTTGAVLSSNTFFKGSGASNPCLALVKNSSSSSTDQAFVVQNGNAGGTTSFQVLANGNAQNTNNSYGAISDAKLKDVIGKAPSYWDKFKQYEFVNYTLKADKSKLQLLGLVAQQVEQISPSLIEELPDADKDGNSLGTTTKGIKYSVVTLQAEVVLQEAQNRIEQLEAIIESLKARLDAANL